VHAGVFTHKTMQGDWDAQAVSRGFVLPKGWLETGLRVEAKQTSAFRDSAGERREHVNTLWRHAQLWAEVRQGFSPQVSLYARVPWVMSSLQPARGTTITTFAMGDAHTGLVFQPLSGENHSVALNLDLKAASGVEWPSGDGGPTGTGSFLTGTGITNLGTHVLGRFTALDRIRLDGAAGYVRKFPGIVGYVVQTDGFGNGWIDPGDEWVLHGGVQTQVLDWVAVSAGVGSRYQSVSRIGVSGEGTTSLDLSPVAQTGGNWVDGQLGLSLEPSDHWGVEYTAARDIAGPDSRTWAHLGLEEFSPQPGWTHGVRAVSRW
jgi:hypothetical protein